MGLLRRKTRPRKKGVLKALIAAAEIVASGETCTGAANDHDPNLRVRITDPFSCGTSQRERQVSTR